MSPEQARALPQDERTDIFSLGSLLYACVTGRPPFRGNTALDCIRATVSAEPDWSALPADTPGGLRAIITRCLAKDTGLRPQSAAEVRGLIEALGAEVPARVAPPAAGPAAPGNLPRQLTSFVGRRHALEELGARLAAEPLITLTGIGGCGKTRLALQLAAQSAELFPDGRWFVELAPLSDGERVPAAVAKAIGLREQPGRPFSETIADALRDAAALLVLDNCEHLLAGIGELAETLLQSCPRLKILATSREGLGIPGEMLWQVPSLDVSECPAPGVPGARMTAAEAMQCEALELFADRARAASRSFTLTDENVDLVAAICRRLDGIPLAIELAAARVRVLSVEQIHEKLDDRFRLLTGGSRTALERHRTLRATLDWSYNLLSDREKLVLQRLSVFAAGWTLPAATVVCGDGLDEFEALDILTHLVDKSLVQSEEAAGDERRYRLLETMRQFAREELARSGDAAQVQDRHLEHFLALAERAAPELRGPAQVRWLDLLQREHENLLAALDWCDSGPDGAVRGLRLCNAIWWFWLVRGHFTLGRRKLHSALGRPGAECPTPARAAALNSACALAGMQGNYDAARPLAEESLAIARELDDKPSMARCWNNLGLIAAKQGDDGAARSYHEQALAIRRDLGDKPGVAASLNNLGSAALDRGDFGEARRRLEESLSIQRELGNRHDMAVLLTNLGLAAGRQGDAEACRRFYEESLTLHREMRNQHGVAQVLNLLGCATLDQGDPAGAERWFLESRDILEALGDRMGLADALNNLGNVALHRAEHGRARGLYEQSLAVQRELGDRRRIAALLGNRGLVAQLEGDPAGARRLYGESLAIRVTLEDEPGIARLFENVGQLALGDSAAERAAQVLGCASALREALGLGLSAGECPRHEEAVSRARAALGEPAFERAWASGRALPWRAALERVRACLQPAD
jgi:predicted ATPase/Tfp pilus assembly protein PilF